jgi:fatty-acyl-CoA synthase
LRTDPRLGHRREPDPEWRWVTSGYLRPEDDSNRSRFTADGWFRTGDVARISRAGIVEIVDRKKDLIKSGGEWISSLELERAILEFPGVIDAAVIAVPDPEWGERPLAVLAVASEQTIDQPQLRSFLRRRVASWWVPERFELVDELPKTGVGKHHKRALRLRYGGYPPLHYRGC